MNHTILLLLAGCLNLHNEFLDLTFKDALKVTLKVDNATFYSNILSIVIWVIPIIWSCKWFRIYFPTTWRAYTPDVLYKQASKKELIACPSTTSPQSMIIKQQCIPLKSHCFKCKVAFWTAYGMEKNDNTIYILK